VIQPTSSLAATDTIATSVANGTAIRLRVNIGVATATLTTSTQSFKFQFATSTATSSSAWTDVGSTSSATIWKGYDNPSVSDGATITAFLLSSSTAKETYEENPPTATNTTAIAVNGFGEWDRTVQDNGATASTTYYF